MRSATQQIEQAARMATLLRRTALPPASAEQLRQPRHIAPTGRMSEIYWGVALGEDGPGTQWLGDVNPCEGPDGGNVNTSVTISVSAVGGHYLTSAVYPADYPDSGDPANVIPFQFDARGEAFLVGSGYYAPPIRSIRWWGNDLVGPPRGWRWMDGTDNAGHYGGLDMRGRVLLQKGSYNSTSFSALESGGCVEHEHNISHSHGRSDMNVTSVDSDDGPVFVAAQTQPDVDPYDDDSGGFIAMDASGMPNASKAAVPYAVPYGGWIQRIY